MAGFRRVRVGAAALAAGLALAGPHAAVAAADSSSDAESAAASAGTPGNPDGAAGRAAQPRTAPPRAAARAARPAAPTPAPARSAAAVSNSAVANTTGKLSEPRRNRTPAPAAAIPAPAAALAQPVPQHRAQARTSVAAADPAAPPASPVAVAASQSAAPVAVAASQSAAPAAPCGSCQNPGPPAPSLSATAPARLTAVLDSIGHWLADLPATPGTEFLSGALLTVRRTLLPAATVTPNPPALSAANGAGPVLTGITSTPGSTSLVLTFDAPLISSTATDLANYSITAPTLFGNPEIVTSSGPKVKVVAAQYSDISPTASQVTLTLAHPLCQGTFYRIFINGELPIVSGNPNSNPLTGVNGATFDGDNDATPGGDFYGLFAVGTRLAFTDSGGDRVVLKATGGSGLNVWRELNGDIDQVSVLPGASALSGSVTPGKASTGTVLIGSVTLPVPTPLNLNGAADNLPTSFVTSPPPGGLPTSPPLPTTTSPSPVVATSANLPYTLNISPVSASGIANLPGIQSGVYAQMAPTRAYPSGLWVVLGGRTNGLHNFSPSGQQSFPPDFQNGVIYVINPANWQVWSLPWNQTGVPASVYNSLTSSNQEYYQKGDTVYTVGGYSVPGTVSFTGDVSTASKNITVTSGLENLAVGQTLSGVLPFPSGQQIFPSGTTITAINGDTVTASKPTEADATGVSLAAFSSDFTTYDTLTALSIKGLVQAVINGGDVASLAKIRQMSDPRLAVTGGEMKTLNGRTYLTLGHDFQGGYNGTTGTADISQVYTDEIRSFNIIDTGRRLGIANYQAQRDPVNFRRRDGNLVNFVGSFGQQELAYLGGVFTPDTNGYQAPILIGPGGRAAVDPAYQQFFSQYTTANVPLYDPRSRSMYDILLGGISLYDYSNGQLTEQTGLPWVDDVTSLVQAGNGSFQEYIMPPIPSVTADGTGYYGANAALFGNQALPTYRNGVIRLNKLRGPTVVGYMYGGIYSTVPTTGNNTFAQTGASNQVFQITLTPS